MGYDDILYEAGEGIARLTLNRPGVGNRLRGHTYEEILMALGEAERDAAVGVVIISGTGGVFSVGEDMLATEDFGPGEMRSHLKLIAQLTVAIRNLGKPLIAEVRGPCLGAANQLQLLCDITLASQDAIFGQTASRGGEIPFLWGAQMLPRTAGEKRAREICFLSREYTAEEARGMQFINEVHLSKDLSYVVDEMCREVLSLSPASLRMVSASINYGFDLHLSAIFHACDFIPLMMEEREKLGEVEAPAPGPSEVFNYESFDYRVEGMAAVITFRGSEKNGIYLAEFIDALRRAEADNNARAVVITSSGEFFFGDLCPADQGKEGRRLEIKSWIMAAATIRNMGKPVIAAINGRASGVGHQLHLLCDLTLSSECAVFCQDEGCRGDAPSLWGSQLLARNIGERKAREISLMGSEVSAEEALHMRLINAVIPHGDLMVEVDQWCREIAKLDPVAVGLAKTSLNYGSDLSYPAIWQGREISALMGK